MDFASPPGPFHLFREGAQFFAAALMHIDLDLDQTHCRATCAQCRLPLRIPTHDHAPVDKTCGPHIARQRY